MNNNDLRVIKSKKAIKTAFLMLMKEKGYNNITVKDIAERALINRKTFYMHYETKQILYDEICDELMEVLAPEPIFATLQELEGKAQRKPIIYLLNKIRKEKEVFSVLINDESNNDFINKLNSLISSVLISKAHILENTKGDVIDGDLLIKAYQSLFILILKWWIDNDHDDPDLVIDLILMFFSKKPLELLGIDFKS